MAARDSKILDARFFYLARFCAVAALVLSGRPEAARSDARSDIGRVASTMGPELPHLRRALPLIADDMILTIDPEVRAMNNKMDKMERQKLAAVVSFISSGAALLASGLVSQLAVSKGNTESNVFRYVSYGAMEAVLIVPGIVILTAIIAMQGDFLFLLLPAALLAAAAVYGVYGWKLRDNEAMYYASTSTASAALMLLGTIFSFD